MIALDTNILARLWLRDNPKEVHLAELLLEKYEGREQFFIALPLFIELAWVLSRKGFQRQAVFKALWQLLETDNILVSQASLVTRALTLYKTGKADFADYLIMCESTDNGAKAIASFDAALVKEQSAYCHYPSTLL